MGSLNTSKMAEVQQDEEKDKIPEEDKEFQLREQIRICMEAQIQSELKKIKEKEAQKKKLADLERAKQLHQQGHYDELKKIEKEAQKKKLEDLERAKQLHQQGHYDYLKKLEK